MTNTPTARRRAIYSLVALTLCLVPAIKTVAQSDADAEKRDTMRLLAQAQQAADPASPTTPVAPTAPATPDAEDPADAPERTPGGRPPFGPRGGDGPRGDGEEGEGGENRGPITANSTVTLQFPLNPVSNLLDMYERLLGKTIVKDSSIFEGQQVSLVTPTAVSRDEAVRLIEATLLLNGYVLVADPDGESVKVLLGRAKNDNQTSSFSEGIVIYTADDELPTGQTLIGYFMELDHISPEDAATLFGNHVLLNEYGRITPVSEPSGLLITEGSSIVRQLVQLKRIIDVPTESATLLTEFVQLEYAEANVVAQILQAAMDARQEERERQSELGRTVSGEKPREDNNGGNNGGNGNNNARREQQNNNNSANEGSGIGTADQPAAQLIPDDRLNRIMVVATPSDAAEILQLIKEFDQPLDAQKPIERPLNYVKANDILPVIVDVLQDTGTGQTQLPGGRQIDTRPSPVTSSQLTSLTGTRNTQNNQNRNADTSTEEVGGRADQIAFPINDIAPISVLVGKTRIIADVQSNSIIVMGSKESQDIVVDIIERLDRRPAQVYLATVIGELTLGDDIQFGLDYLQKFTPFSGDNVGDGGISGSLINQRQDLITGNAVTDFRDNIITSALGPASGFNVYGQIGESLDVIVNALEATQRFKVLSRPVVYTQNGKRAEITSGQEVPVPVESLSDASGNVNSAAVRTSIDFKEVVLKLEVLPTINQDNEVTLDIVQINDRVIGSQLVADSEVPIIGKQELNTTVTVANRSTIVLGGLISERIEKNEAGVPIISRIPLFGNLAKNTNNSTTRSELMIFIQPIVVRGDEDVFEASHDEDVRSEIGSDLAREFPEPGRPTVIEKVEKIEDEKKGFVGRVGRRIFGKQTDRAKPIFQRKLEPIEVEVPVQLPVAE